MDRAAQQIGAPEQEEDADRGADCRPDGVSHTEFVTAGLQLLDDGHEPLPLLPGKHAPAVRSWRTRAIDKVQIGIWARLWPAARVGLRTGRLVAVAITVDDPDLAHALIRTCEVRLGATVGQIDHWPGRTLFFRTDAPFPSTAIPGVEIRSQGSWVDLGKPGASPWRRVFDPDSGPEPMRLDELPLIDERMAEAFLAEAAGLVSVHTASRRSRKRQPDDPVRDQSGHVVAGLGPWMETIARHTLLDAIDAKVSLDVPMIAGLVMARFMATAAVEPNEQDAGNAPGPMEAHQLVATKIAELAEGRLPTRDHGVSSPPKTPVRLGADAARGELEQIVGDFVREAVVWHARGGHGDPPRLALLATTGLGKSATARKHALALIGALRAQGLPHRILWTTSSLALAEEAARAWEALGARTAVLRGYEARDPVHGTTMCSDLTAVRAAIEAHLSAHNAVCLGTDGRACAHAADCPKLRNRRDVAEADVVVAAYDALFREPAAELSGLALVVVDEACWPRSVEETGGVAVEDFLAVDPVAPAMQSQKPDASVDAERLDDARQRLAVALLGSIGSSITATGLAKAGLTVERCREVIAAEEQQLPRVGLSPGQPGTERLRALKRASVFARGRLRIAIWEAALDLLEGKKTAVGRLWVAPRNASREGHPITLLRARTLAPTFASVPLLHLDATLRPELAEVVLPAMEMRKVEASAPFQSVRLVVGGFGKGSLVPIANLSAEEASRRANRLREVVEYVRWHAARQKGRRILVVTYAAIEAAFTGIDGVETTHFNALAGLDAWHDVSALFVIGRPLPSSGDLARVVGGLFGIDVRGGYRSERVGVSLANGRSGGVSVVRHADERAELIRAAIVDDEIVQAIGRGRGVNRTADNPLEVHVLADVAPPLDLDQVVAWEALRPGIIEEMLLAGLAVDSPKDAAALHPRLFANAKQAQKAFERAGFERQIPIGNVYREMSLKSAEYRRGGRGASWQAAFWILGSGEEARTLLEAAIGHVAEWREQAT